MISPSTLRPDFRLEPLLRDLRRHLPMVPNPEDRGLANDWLQKVEARLAQEPPLGADELEQIVNEFTYHCLRCQLQPILAANNISYPPYNHLGSFDDNVDGPWAPIPTWQVVSPPLYKVLGFPVGLPFGIPASALTVNAVWIEFFARQGCHVLTYKTVRSGCHEAHAAPNWVFLDNATEPLVPGQTERPVFIGEPSSWPANSAQFSMANSFGVPSPLPEEWQADLKDALSRLRDDQLLIVSVMGDSENKKGDELRDDFVKVAKLAEEAGARAIELNLSCPNTVDPATHSVKSVLCEDATLTHTVVSAVRAALKVETRLVAKLCYLPFERLRATIEPLFPPDGRPLVDGVSGINTLQAEVRDSSDSPTFGDGRLRAGISGVAIRDLGLDFVRSLARIRHDLRTERGVFFDIIAMGGVMTAEDVQRYMDEGATAVQSASGMFRNPDLARQVYEFFGGQPQSEAQAEARERVLTLLSCGGPLTFGQLKTELESVFEPSYIIASKTRAVLSSLEADGLISSSRVDAEVQFQTLPPS